MKKIILAYIFSLLTVAGFSQVKYDSTKVMQDINAEGYSYKNLEVRGKLRLYRDTFPMAYRDSGSIAYKNKMVYAWTGTYWKPVGTDKLVYGDWWITPININDSTVQFTFNQTALDSAIAAGGGGGASQTLQQAFDIAPTVNPQINVHGNSLNIDSVGSFSYFTNYETGRRCFYGFEDGGFLSQYVRNTGGVPNTTALLIADKLSFYNQGVMADSAVLVTLDTTKFTIQSPLTEITGGLIIPNGNVGIGTTTPTEKLDVAGGVKCDSLNIGDTWFYTKKITLTPSEIQTANTSPVELIPAPGAGKALNIISASYKYIFNSTSYSAFPVASIRTGDGISFYFNDEDFFLDSYNSISRMTANVGHDILAENHNAIYVADNNIADGDTPITFYLYYQIINL